MFLTVLSLFHHTIYRLTVDNECQWHTVLSKNPQGSDSISTRKLTKTDMYDIVTMAQVSLGDLQIPASLNMFNSLFSLFFLVFSCPNLIVLDYFSS